MYCPNCSTEASAEQKFCRACGMELQAVATLVSAQVGVTQPPDPSGGTLQPRQRAMIIWGFILTFGAVGVGVGLKMLAKENIHPAGELTPYLSVIAVLLAFFGMGLMCYPFLQMMSPTRKSQPTPSSKPERTSKLKPELHEQPSSITDQTTELLEAAEARTNARDTASQDDYRVVS